MGPKVAKMVNMAQIWTCRPLIRPIIHQWVMLEGPESPKSPHKLVLPENVSIGAFYTVILGKMDPKWENWSIWPKFGPVDPDKAHNSPTGYVRAPRIPQKPP